MENNIYITEIKSLLSKDDFENNKDLIKSLSLKYNIPLIIELLKLGYSIEKVEKAADLLLLIDRNSSITYIDILENFGKLQTLFSLK